MNVKQMIGRMLGRKEQGPFDLTDTKRWLGYFGGAAHSGESVTQDTAMQLSAVWACIRLTATAVSSIPCRMYEKEGRGGRKPIDHPLNEILGVSPNDELTGLEFWEAMTAWLMVNGNAYAEIVRTGHRITALNILPADQVDVIRNSDREARYIFTENGKRYDLPAEDILHLRGLSFGGLKGLSPIRWGVQTMGSAIAADKVSGRTFANGMMPSGIVYAPPDMEVNDEHREQFEKMLQNWMGSNNAGKAMIFEDGLKFEQISINPEDMQLLETRRFHIEEIARWFGVPPVMIGHAAEGVTQWGTGVESIVLQWMTMGLGPLLTKIERRISKQLIAPGERQRVYAHFNREAIMAMDSTAKAAFLSTMVQNGIYSRARARELLEEPYIEGTDILTAQTNLAPLDKLGAESDARTNIRRALGMEDDT